MLDYFNGIMLLYWDLYKFTGFVHIIINLSFILLKIFIIQEFEILWKKVAQYHKRKITVEFSAPDLRFVTGFLVLPFPIARDDVWML